MQRAVTGLCWASAFGLLLWAILRVFGLERGFPLVPLFAYTPQVAGAGVLVVAALAALRRWSALAVAAAAVVTLGFAVVPRTLGSAPAPHGPVLRVMSANLYFGSAPAES